MAKRVILHKLHLKGNEEIKIISIFPRISQPTNPFFFLNYTAGPLLLTKLNN